MSLHVTQCELTAGWGWLGLAEVQIYSARAANRSRLESLVKSALGHCHLQVYTTVLA